MNFVWQMDLAVLNFISITLKNGFFDIIMPLITSMGNRYKIWLVIIGLLLIRKDTRYMGIVASVSLLLSILFGDLMLKHIFARHRPYQNISDYKYLISMPHSYSFPSGHTSSSFSVSGAIWFCNSRFKYGVFILAAVVAFSRMYVRVHYPTDVIGGIIVGLICAKMALAICKRADEYRKRQQDTN